MVKRIEKFYQEREKLFQLYNTLCNPNITIKELDELEEVLYGNKRTED